MRIACRIIMRISVIAGWTLIVSSVVRQCTVASMLETLHREIERKEQSYLIQGKDVEEGRLVAGYYLLYRDLAEEHMSFGAGKGDAKHFASPVSGFAIGFILLLPWCFVRNCRSHNVRSMPNGGMSIAEDGGKECRSANPPASWPVETTDPADKFF